MTRKQWTAPSFEVKPDKDIRRLTELLPPYKVILFNDDYNEMDFVIFALLHSVNNLTTQEATQIMLTAHATGSAVVISCPKELAEYYQERLIGYGLIATIEPD